jgi:hypothetical protein
MEQGQICVRTVTSAPIELHATLVDFVDKVRIYSNALPNDAREIGGYIRAAALEAERTALLIMRDEPQVDLLDG